MITIIEVAIVLSFYAVGYGCNRMITRTCCDTPSPPIQQSCKPRVK